MKKLLLVLCIIMFAVISVVGDDAKVKGLPEIPREFRAAWVATVANIDFPSSKNLTTEQQKAEAIKILDMCQDLNMNAVVFQVRPMCDALYDSKLEPWSEFLTGKWGKAPEPYYDPLKFWCDEAHKRGLELHAWFNPYRAHHPSCKTEMPANHISKIKPDTCKKYGRYLWLDPSHPDTRKHSLDVMIDVVKRYDIDGVHMDDYFYPYQEKDKDGNIIEFPDDANWKAYKEAGGEMSRGDWRRDGVNNFIKMLYDAIKKEDPTVKLGISPFGIWRPGYPSNVVGFDQYENLYADAKLWFEEGWVDYFTPQLYWSIDSKGQPYKDLLKWWAEQNKKGRHLWPGNYTSRILASTWKAEEIVDQVKFTQELEGASGNVHFSMKTFLQDGDGINEKIKKVYAEQALVPASTWLDDKAPAKPQPFIKQSKDGITIIANAPKDDVVRNWVVYTKTDKWSYKIYGVAPGQKLKVSLPENDGLTMIGVSAVDASGNESEIDFAKLK